MWQRQCMVALILGAGARNRPDTISKVQLKPTQSADLAFAAGSEYQ
jgi:hypothetical protein